MGLFDLIFGNNAIDIIEWQEENDSTVLWKFPSKDSAINYGAHLIVRESQMAILVNEGQIADTFWAGRHELETNNMPVLTKLKNWQTGFKSPFLTDVYFISARTFTNLRWGTQQPIIINDKQLGTVQIKAFGTYFLQIKDAAAFFREFTGTNSLLSIEELEEKLRNVIIAHLAETIAEANLSVGQLAQNYTELGATILPHLQKIYQPFGIEILRFDIGGLTLPEDMLTKLENTPPPLSPQNDTLQLIENLALLRDKGILSTEEFEKKKQELINRL